MTTEDPIRRLEREANEAAFDRAAERMRQEDRIAFNEIANKMMLMQLLNRMALYGYKEPKPRRD